MHTLRINCCVRVHTNEGASQALSDTDSAVGYNILLALVDWIFARAVDLINVRRAGNNKMNHLNDTRDPPVEVPFHA
jgi:hypothetical protein